MFKKELDNKPKLRFSIIFLIIILIMGGCFAIFMLYDDFENLVVQKPIDESSKAEESVDFVPNPIKKSNKKDNTYLSKSIFISEIDMKYFIDNNLINKKNVLPINSSDKDIKDTISSNSIDNIYIVVDINKTKDNIIEEKMSIIRNIVNFFKSSYPEVKIYVISSLPEISDNGLNTMNNLIDEFNSELLSYANSSKIYFVDVNTAMKGNDATLNKEYYDGDILNDKGHNAFLDYILTHTVN